MRMIHSVSRPLSLALLASGMAFSSALPVTAQQSAPSAAETQRAAMSKLAFLAGHWSGPITVVRGPGEPLHLTQTENVQFKLDGLVLLIEGKATDAQGNTPFSALATVSWDDASHTYRFRAYNDGRYIDTELSVVADGFSWGFTSGPAHVVNSMHLSDKGAWDETTDVTVGSNPPMHSVEMHLQHQP